MVHRAINTPPVIDERTILTIATKPRPASVEIDRRDVRAVAAYTGGRLLIPHIKPYSREEDDEKFAWRCERSVDHYDNYPDSTASIYIEGVFGNNGVTRTTGLAELDEWLATDYATYRRTTLAPAELLRPESYVFFHWKTLPPNPETGEPIDPETRADEIELKNWPRVSFTSPRAVVNFERDDDGNLQWISRRIIDTTGRYGAEGKALTEVFDERYRYICRDNEVVAGEEHGFDTVPALRFTWRDEIDEQYGLIGRAMLDGVVNRSLACLQWVSMLVEAGYFHLNLQLVIDAEDLKATEKQGGRGNAQAIIKSRPDSTDPFYLQKPNMEVATLERLIYERTPEQIMRLARLRDRGVAAATSGLAKVLDSQPELQAMKSVSDYFQANDEKIVRFITRNYRENYPQEKIEVRYPTTFNFTTAEENLRQVTTLAAAQTNAPAMPQSRTMLATMIYDAFEKLFPDAQDETKKAVRRELDQPPQHTYTRGESTDEEGNMHPDEANEADDAKAEGRTTEGRTTAGREGQVRQMQHMTRRNAGRNAGTMKN